MSTTPPVLDLTELVPERAIVKIPTATHPEGENFELKGEGELSLVVLKRVEILTEKVSTQWTAGIETVEDAEQMDRMIEELYSVMFHRVPDTETRKAMPQLRQYAVISFFNDVCSSLMRERTENAETTEPTNLPTEPSIGES